MNLAEYTVLKRKAVVLDDNGDFDIKKGEMNPEIFNNFIPLYMNRGEVLWDAFAGHTGKNSLIDVCGGHGVDLISYDLEPSDDRVLQADSTVVPPPCLINGIVFHPPYFGTGSFSDKKGELSNIDDKSKFIENLEKTVKLACDNMVGNYGIACVVGRSYMARGEKISFDYWLVDMFTRFGFKIDLILSSMPDVAVIMERRL